MIRVKVVMATCFVLLGLLASLMVIFVANSSGTSTVMWTRTYGGPYTDWAYSVIQTSDGGYALAGHTNSYSAGGQPDAWLVKTNSSGNMQWNKTYGGSGADWAYSVIQTSDGGYALAGSTNSSGAGEADFWLVKTDSSGNMQWNKTYGGTSYDWAHSVVQTTDGGYALAGGTTSFGAGEADFWLVKTDSSGNMQWNKTYGGPKFDFAQSLIQTSDGGYALAGYTYSYGAGDYDFYLVKTDGSGNMQWSKTYGGTKTEVAYSVVQTTDGGYALAGETDSYGAGNYDFWLVKTDSSGNQQWSKTYGGASDDVVFSVIQTSDDGYALLGYTYSYGAGDSDFWLVKTDSSGIVQWLQTYGGTGSDSGQSLVQTSDGGYALAGATNSYGGGDFDFWLVKTDKFGAIAPELAISTSANPNVVYSGETSTIKVSATSSGTPVSGANISLASDLDGSFSTVNDYMNGTYTATYTAPMVSMSTTCTITTSVSKQGYSQGNDHVQLTVNPLVLNIYTKDAEGNPITGVTVVSTSQPSGQASLSGTTDTNGLVSFTGIQSGAYTIKCSKDGYEDKTLTLTVIAGQIKTDNATLSKITGPSGLSISPILIASIVIVLILIGAAVALLLRRKK
jgi:hypothetical protein